MRKLSKLAALAPADQNHVINLCSKHPYEHVVILLAKPRGDGGLDLQTSRSALCRFATTFHPDPDRLAHEIERLMPLLEATTQDAGLFPDAIRALLQQHIFSELAANKPFDTVARPFRILFKLEEQRRSQNGTPGGSKRDFPHLSGTLPPEKAHNSASPANSAQKNLQKNLPKNLPHP
jgi:hypothetical protein